MQWTDFYMIGTSVMKELNLIKYYLIITVFPISIESDYSLPVTKIPTFVLVWLHLQSVTLNL